MAKQRFVLRFVGEGSKPAGDVERIRRVAAGKVLDETPRMMLVESDEEPLRELVGSLPEWAIAPEQHIPLADGR